MLKKLFRRSNSVLHNIEERLNHLEQSLNKVTEEGFKNNIQIDTLHVDNVTLDKFEFRFDQLDIEEVSGALNLGNNFGVRVHPKISLKRREAGDISEDNQARSEFASHDETTDNGTRMSKTPDGFTFQFSSK